MTSSHGAHALQRSVDGVPRAWRYEHLANTVTVEGHYILCVAEGTCNNTWPQGKPLLYTSRLTLVTPYRVGIDDASLLTQRFAPQTAVAMHNARSAWHMAVTIHADVHESKCGYSLPLLHSPIYYLLKEGW